MKLKLTLILFFLCNTLLFSQVASLGNDVLLAKEFSKEIALYNSKNYLFKNVFGSNSDVVKFEVVPLAAASSGELTTLLYKCESKQKEGLVLGFYGNYWNENGVVHQAFGFRNFEKIQAIEFLNKIQTAIDNNLEFLNDGSDNNNIYFKYDDVDVLIWTSSPANTYYIRLFWNNFDSSWEKTSFTRSKKRFEKKIK